MTARALAAVGDARAIAPLARALTNPSRWALSLIAEDALLLAMKDTAWEVRAQSAKALGRIGNPAHADALVQAMPDMNWWVRNDCAMALVCLSHAGLQGLELLVAHVDPYVRDRAVAAVEIYGLKVRQPSRAAGSGEALA